LPHSRRIHTSASWAMPTGEYHTNIWRNPEEMRDSLPRSLSSLALIFLPEHTHFGRAFQPKRRNAAFGASSSSDS
jgi:hypothetical protein